MNLEKYTEHAKEYEAYRSGYPQALYTYLEQEFPGLRDQVIADIGSGTGKLGRPFIEDGTEVFCVEPNAGMRLVAENLYGKYPRFHSITGNAEYTTLADHSVDYVMVGTAFHWFDECKFQKECRRILKSPANVILVWLSRPVNVVSDDFGNVRFELNDQGRSGGKEETPELFEHFFLPGTMKYKIVKEEVEYQKEAFIERVISTFHTMDSEANRHYLARLFNEASTNGKIKLPLYARCITGEV